MDADIRKKSVQVYEFLDGHPNYSRVKLKDVFNHFKPKTVDSYFDRWHKKRKTIPTSKRSSHIPQNSADNADGKKGEKEPLVSLSKLDEVGYEAYLLHVANNSDPSITIAREIRSYLDNKKAIRIATPKSDKSEEQLDMDFKAIMDGAANYTRDIDISTPS